jgi:hypothetical protein
MANLSFVPVILATFVAVIESRTVEFRSPPQTAWVLMASEDHQDMEMLPDCSDEGKFHECIRTFARSRSLRINRTGAGTTFSVTFNARVDSRLYYTCDRRFDPDTFLTLSVKNVVGRIYSVPCQADEGA